MDRIQQLVAKARMGDITPEEQDELRQALKTVAPASQEFRTISSVLNAAGPAQAPASLPFNTAGNTPNMRQPTLDWAAGLGAAKDAVFNEFEDPFGGNPDLRYNDTPDWEENDGSGASDPGYHADVNSPLPPGTSTKNPSYELGKSPQGGWGPVANSTLGTAYRPDDDVAGVDAVNFPGGYSFSGGNETSVDILKYNPEVYNRMMTEDVMGQPGMESFWENKTKAAMNMASFGLLGNGSGRNDMGGGPTTSTGQLAATEDFMKQFAAPGVQTVDPGQIYRQIFERTGNTDWSKQLSRQGQGPMGPEEIADTTNQALLTSMAFSNPETEAWMTSLLEDAKMQYMMYLAKGGDTSISYPKFLDQTMDFSELI